MGEFDEQRETETRDERPKAIRQEGADLEKVTDYAEEKEISSNVEAKNLIAYIEKNKGTQSRDEELSEVNITREDVELLVKELEITKQQAESALRQNKGDIVQAMVQLLS